MRTYTLRTKLRSWRHVPAPKDPNGGVDQWHWLHMGVVQAHETYYGWNHKNGWLNGELQSMPSLVGWSFAGIELCSQNTHWGYWEIFDWWHNTNSRSYDQRGPRNIGHGWHYKFASHMRGLSAKIPLAKVCLCTKSLTLWGNRTWRNAPSPTLFIWWTPSRASLRALWRWSNTKCSHLDTWHN